MEQIAIYLWSISEGIKNGAFICGIPLLLFTMFPFVEYDSDANEFKRLKPLLKKTFAVSLILLIFALLIPSKKDLALILTYPYIKNGTETVVKSETMNKMKQLTNLYLDEQIKNLKEKK